MAIHYIYILYILKNVFIVHPYKLHVTRLIQSHARLRMNMQSWRCWTLYIIIRQLVESAQLTILLTHSVSRIPLLLSHIPY